MRAVIKIGGALLESEESRSRLAAEIKHAFTAHEIVVVHGWGKQLTKYLAKRGIKSEFVNGLRVTTEEVRDGVLEIARIVNEQLVAAFKAADVHAVGLEELRDGVVDAEPMDPALGYVGRPINANAQLLETKLRLSQLPVIACLAKDKNGVIYNVNGDQVAAACAQALLADRLIYLTDVPGVHGRDNGTIPTLTAKEALDLVDSGVATAGMQAKLNATLSALGAGVKQVVIAPGYREGIVAKAFSEDLVGTRVICS